MTPIYLIKPCPACGTRLRFPVDRGVIKVKCACGHSFRADPDDTEIYRDAAFDLSSPAPGPKGISPLKRLALFDYSRILPAFATRALAAKYRLQNFRLLPAAEKKKTVCVIFLIAACLAGLIAAICLLALAPVAPDAMVI